MDLLFAQKLSVKTVCQRLEAKADAGGPEFSFRVLSGDCVCRQGQGGGRSSLSLRNLRVSGIVIGLTQYRDWGRSTNIMTLISSTQRG